MNLPVSWIRRVTVYRISQWPADFPMNPGTFKALAMGSPYFKAVCMGRGLMIPGMVGKNIEKWIKEGDLPKSVSKYGNTIEEIFVCYEELKEKFGPRYQGDPDGCGRYLYLYAEVQDRSPADYGRQQEFPSLDYVAG